MNTTLAKKICEKAKEIGYDKCGIIKIEDINGFENQLNKRIKSCLSTSGVSLFNSLISP